MNESLKSFASYLCVAFVLALTLSCSTTPPSKVASTPEFRALADQVKAIISEASATEESISAFNNKYIKAGVPDQSVSRHTVKIWTDEVSLSAAGRLTFAYHKEKRTCGRIISSSLSQNVGEQGNTDYHIYYITLLLADMKEVRVENDTQLSFFANGRGSAEEMIRKGYSVILYAASGKKIPMRHRLNLIKLNEKSNEAPCASFNDEASAKRLADLLNTLINLAKGNAQG